MIKVRDAVKRDLDFILGKGHTAHLPEGAQTIVHQTDGPVMIGGTTVVDVGLHAYTYMNPRLFRKYAKTCTRIVKMGLDAIDTDSVAVFMLALPENTPWAQRLGFDLVSDYVPIGDNLHNLMQLKLHREAY